CAVGDDSLSGYIF
nr:immunoglobulin light chain junction region [Macaca mulatta]